jgi:mutator protein MutT
MFERHRNNLEIKEKNVFINIGIVINKKGEVLIIRRKKPEVTKTGKVLTWAFPGGKQEEGETREESVEKEVLVETGYKVKAISQIHLRLHPDSNLMMAYHQCQLEQEEPVQPIEEVDEIEEVKWVRPEELKKYFTTDLDPVVKSFLKI